MAASFVAAASSLAADRPRFLQPQSQPGTLNPAQLEATLPPVLLLPPEPAGDRSTSRPAETRSEVNAGDASTVRQRLSSFLPRRGERAAKVVEPSAENRTARNDSAATETRVPADARLPRLGLSKLAWPAADRTDPAPSPGDPQQPNSTLPAPPSLGPTRQLASPAARPLKALADRGRGDLAGLANAPLAGLVTAPADAPLPSTPLMAPPALPPTSPVVLQPAARTPVPPSPSETNAAAGETEDDASWSQRLSRFGWRLSRPLEDEGPRPPAGIVRPIGENATAPPPASSRSSDSDDLATSLPTTPLTAQPFDLGQPMPTRRETFRPLRPNRPAAIAPVVREPAPASTPRLPVRPIITGEF